MAKAMGHWPWPNMIVYRFRHRPSRAALFFFLYRLRHRPSRAALFFSGTNLLKFDYDEFNAMQLSPLVDPECLGPGLCHRALWPGPGGGHGLGLCFGPGPEFVHGPVAIHECNSKE